MKVPVLIKYIAVIVIVCPIAVLPVTAVQAESNFIYGDVDSDGNINVADAILVLRHIVGLEILKGDSWYVADVNADGEIDVADVILILRYIVGLEEIFPAQKKIDEAENAVAVAESTMDQSDIDWAQDLVSNLPPITPRSVLQARLDKIAAIRQAIKAIEDLPCPEDITLDDKDAVENARELVEIAIFDHGATNDEIANLDKLISAEAKIALLEDDVGDYKYKVYLITEAENVNVCDKFEVDLIITSEDYDVFHGATIEINYDNTKVQYLGAIDLPDGFSIYSAADGVTATLTIVGASGGHGYQIINKVFLLATLKFEVKSDITSGPITIAIADGPIVNQEDDVQSMIAAKGDDININLMNP